MKSQFDPSKANLVIILTDAYANTGQVDPSLIAENVTRNGEEGIRFAGIGIGSRFNDSFLNELTDIGHSVYSAMITPEDGERIFSDGFMRFIDHAIEDVRFKLSYPIGLHHIFTASEQASTEESDVQEINFSFNDSQFFFELFSATNIQDRESIFTLEATYKNTNGEQTKITIEKTLADMLNAGGSQIQNAAMITTLAQLVAQNISCTEITGSTLYASDNTAPLFDKYKDLIDRYCSLTP